MRYIQVKANLFLVAIFLHVSTIKLENKGEREQEHTFGRTNAQRIIALKLVEV